MGDLDDEKLVRVVVGGVSMLGCGGAGDNRPDYQCDFTECNSSSQTVTADSSGNIAVVATYTNNSKDCDCDQSDPNGNCVKEDTGSAEWTPTKAALKFTLTQAQFCSSLQVHCLQVSVTKARRPAALPVQCWH